MQRASIIPSSSWLPHWSFFVPGSRISPIPIPPLPASITYHGAVSWIGTFAVGIAPFVGVCLSSYAIGLVGEMLYGAVYKRLPKPSNPSRVLRMRDGTVVSSGGMSTAAGLGESGSAELSRTGDDVARAETFPGPGDNNPQAQDMQGLQHSEATANARALTGNSTIPGGPNTSSRYGDGVGDFGSDDEETEVVNPTFISFDVEATDSPDTPPGWCAELRPNVADGGNGSQAGGGPTEPLYRENRLTLLPAYSAARILARPPTRFITEPLESAVFCALARLMLARQGLPADAIREVGIFSWQAFNSLVGLNLVQVFVLSETWSSMLIAVRVNALDAEEWEDFQATGSVTSWSQIAKDAGQQCVSLGATIALLYSVYYVHNNMFRIQIPGFMRRW
jgi:hypothetical protein